jgi:hypothetical protein
VSAGTGSVRQLELWFAKIQCDVRRGVFTWVADLAGKLRRYIRAYEISTPPFAGPIVTRNAEFVLTKSPGPLTRACSLIPEGCYSKRTVGGNPDRDWGCSLPKAGV